MHQYLLRTPLNLTGPSQFKSAGCLFPYIQQYLLRFTFSAKHDSHEYFTRVKHVGRRLFENEAEKASCRSLTWNTVQQLNASSPLNA